MASSKSKPNKFAKKSPELLPPEKLEAVADELNSLLGTDQYDRTHRCFYHSRVAAAILGRDYPGRFHRILTAVIAQTSNGRSGSGVFVIRLDARVDRDEYHYSLLDGTTGYILDFQLPCSATYRDLPCLGENPRYVYQPANRRIGNLQIDILTDMQPEIDSLLSLAADHAERERELQRILSMVRSRLQLHLRGCNDQFKP